MTTHVDDAEHFVEILDNGNFVGRADVLDGKWVYESSGLSVGTHQFVARFNGVVSQSWSVTGIEVDDFENAPLGPQTFLQRRGYSISATMQGSSSSPAAHPMTVRDGGVSPISGRFLHLDANTDDVSRFGSTTTFVFDQPVVEVGFDYKAIVGAGGGRIDLLNAGGGVIRTLGFPLSQPDGHLVLRPEGGDSIKTLRVILNIAPYATPRYILIDNLSMVR